MLTYVELQEAVHNWSLANFGEQETPYLAVRTAGTIKPGNMRTANDRPGDTIAPCVAELGGLAPLMGVVEEIGELVEAIEAGDEAGIIDAIGDIFIYLCDYCGREGVLIPHKPDIPIINAYEEGIAGLSVYIGKLYYCHLKRYQRIRGMHDFLTFDASRFKALYHFMFHLEMVAKSQTTRDLLSIANDTWAKVTSKRNWKKMAADGGDHTHNNTNK